MSLMPAPVAKPLTKGVVGPGFGKPMALLQLVENTQRSPNCIALHTSFSQPA